MKIRLSDLRVAYQDQPVLHGIDLEIAGDSTLAIVGPSGGGKSTLLMAIAGVVPLGAGEIRIGEHEVTHTAPHRRDVSMMFQGETLYPHLTIRNGIACTLRGNDSDDRVREAADRFGVGELLGRYPHQISGGQRRRCGLARMAAQGRRVRLFDEPLSGLDQPLADEMARDLAIWNRQSPGTTIIVTHQMRHALRLADQIAVLADGRVLQCGAADQLRRDPGHRSVAAHTSPSPFQLVEPTATSTWDLPESVPRDGSVQIGFSAADGRPAIGSSKPGDLLICPSSVRKLADGWAELIVDGQVILASAGESDRWWVSRENWFRFDRVSGDRIRDEPSGPA